MAIIYINYRHKEGDGAHLESVHTTFENAQQYARDLMKRRDSSGIGTLVQSVFVVPVEEGRPRDVVNIVEKGWQVTRTSVTEITAPLALIPLKHEEEAVEEKNERLHHNDPPGTMVVFDAGGGYDHQKQAAKEVLVLEQIYEVASIEVGGWTSYVTLVGVTGRFNTSLFRKAR